MQILYPNDERFRQNPKRESQKVKETSFAPNVRRKKRKHKQILVEDNGKGS